MQPGVFPPSSLNAHSRHWQDNVFFATLSPGLLHAIWLWWFKLQDVKSVFGDVWFEDPNDQCFSICSSLQAMPVVTGPKNQDFFGTSILLTQVFRRELGIEKEDLYFPGLDYTILHRSMQTIHFPSHIVQDMLHLKPSNWLAVICDNKPLSSILFSKGHLLVIHKTSKTICTYTHQIHPNSSSLFFGQ